VGGAATTAAAPVAVAAAGYTSSGVAAGSWAAATMSAEAIAGGGGVAAGGFSATMQSIGAAGMGLGLTTAVAGVGVVAGVGATWLGKQGHTMYWQHRKFSELLEVAESASNNNNNNKNPPQKGPPSTQQETCFVVQSQPWNRRFHANQEDRTVHGYGEPWGVALAGAPKSMNTLQLFRLVPVEGESLVVSLRSVVTGNFVSVNDRCDVVMTRRSKEQLSDQEKFWIWFVTDNGIVTFRCKAFKEYRYLRMHPSGHVDCEGRKDTEQSCGFLLRPETLSL